MAGKNKGGRETKKPKASSNVKTTGQTPGQVNGVVGVVAKGSKG
jgi:hypothetical protein